MLIGTEHQKQIVDIDRISTNQDSEVDIHMSEDGEGSVRQDLVDEAMDKIRAAVMVAHEAETDPAAVQAAAAPRTLIRVAELPRQGRVR